MRIPEIPNKHDVHVFFGGFCVGVIVSILAVAFVFWSGR